MERHAALPALVAVAALCAGCLSLDYDLSTVPVPVSAKPAEPGAAAVEPFRIETRNTLWVHGLFGHDEPDVAALVAREAEGWDRIAGFRVRQETGFSHWALTHLSLTLVRMHRVVIEGELVRDAAP